MALVKSNSRAALLRVQEVSEIIIELGAVVPVQGCPLKGTLLTLHRHWTRRYKAQENHRLDPPSRARLARKKRSQSAPEINPPDAGPHREGAGTRDVLRDVCCYDEGF